MPKIPIDYSKCIMYKLCCKDINITDCYIGHTSDFRKRKATHKSDCNNPNNKRYNLNVYQFIRANGGWYNFDMVMIEEYKCSSSLEAAKRERELYEELKATLNKNVPSRSNTEYYKDNFDRINEKKKEQFNCACGGNYTYTNKMTHFNSQKHRNYEAQLNDDITIYSKAN